MELDTQDAECSGCLTGGLHRMLTRLIEARRLMVTEVASVAEAAHQVGYESASQFSREYARMFGAPPRRDAEELRSTAPNYTSQPMPMSA